MIQGRKLYSRIEDRETILELWGGSTKHPDSIFTSASSNFASGLNHKTKSSPGFSSVQAS